mgnify:CR=1 FL=1
MAVREIKNPNLPSPNQVKSVNRASQFDVKNYKDRGGNKQQSRIPGLGSNAKNNYSIDLKDLDTTVISHIRDVMKLKVFENGELIDMPVLYGNEERWVNARKRGAIRDKNGSLVLPLLMLKRTAIDRNDLSGQSFAADLTGEHIQVVRSSTYSKDNRYSNFFTQHGKLPVTDSIVTGMPDFLDATYEFVIWTSYIEQMNKVVEEFVQHSDQYWGSPGNYKFLSKVEGSISDASEITVGGDRVVKTNFTVTLKGYIIPEVLNNVITKKVFNMKKIISPGKVSFSEKIQF